MKRTDLTRRDFHRLTAAALGGAVAGSFLNEPVEAGEEESLLLKEPHVCCGLNTCKGLGASKENECAGMGDCATAEKHTCMGQGSCAGQGGCGEKPGENSCKGEGSCGVPLSAETWQKARANFEAAMKKAGKAVGAAPESCGK